MHPHRRTLKELVHLPPPASHRRRIHGHRQLSGQRHYNASHRSAPGWHRLLELFHHPQGHEPGDVEGDKDSGAVVIAYGQFINSVIKFLIVAFAVFLLIKQVNRFVTKKEAAPAAPPPPEIELLTQIRDLLKSRR